MSKKRENHIALFLASLRGGGAERVFINLAQHFVEKGIRADIVVSHLKGSLISEVPKTCQIVELGHAGLRDSLLCFADLPFTTFSRLMWPILARRPKKLRCYPKLNDYLKRVRPNVLLSTTNIANLLAIWSAQKTQVPNRVVVRQSNNLVYKIKRGKDSLDRHLPSLLRQWYPKAHAIIAVSNGVADEMATITGVTRESIHIVHNPLDLNKIDRLASHDPMDAWLQPGQPPVILSAGRLHPQKDYLTLLRAFKRVVQVHPARMIILGEGNELSQLTRLATALGIADLVKFPGFLKNPYGYMKRASVFVLSSAWEGFPNVLLEALANGCPIVSTDCPSGPSEILGSGRYGRLVPVGDAKTMSQAILATLSTKPAKPFLAERAKMFAIDRITNQYLEILFSGLLAPC
jgi:glycosyltransferase involved in cell wall biosynthesis